MTLLHTSSRHKISQLSLQYVVATFNEAIYLTKRFPTPWAIVPTFIFSAINQHLKWKTNFLCEFHLSFKESTNLMYFTCNTLGRYLYRKCSFINAHNDTGKLGKFCKTRCSFIKDMILIFGISCKVRSLQFTIQMSTRALHFTWNVLQARMFDNL